MAKARVDIDEKRCKGCEICVALCPAQVLVMNKFKASVVDIEKCTACMQCELRCPDFAINVAKISDK